MQQLKILKRQQDVFEAVSEATQFPDLVTLIVSDYVMTKEQDDLLKLTMLHVNTQARAKFVTIVPSYHATSHLVWRNHQRLVKNIIKDEARCWKEFKFQFIRQPWQMKYYLEFTLPLRNILNSTQEIFDDIPFLVEHLPIEYKITNEQEEF